MALRTPLTAQPHLYIGDSTGRPLDYGRVYFGEPNKDPEFYPIDIYLDPEMTIAAAQPVRTKGGFMDVGGNLAELHAAEVVYSLKVLDQYGRQVFYKPEMYRNNVSDFLVDEITRATAAETLIAGNLTAETQRAVAAEKVIADAVVTEKDRAVAAEGLLDDKYEGLSTTIGSIGGGKKAYTTYDKMVAAAALPEGDPLKLPANSSVDVTNDSDANKNATYTYDGTTFAKSAYDLETLVRNKVINSFPTLAKMQMDGAILANGTLAQVYNETANNGLYVKEAGAWVKSKYDVSAILAGEILKASRVFRDEILNSSKNLFNASAAIEGRFMTSTGLIGSSYPDRYMSEYIPVAQNTDYTISSSSATYPAFDSINYLTSDKTFISRVDVTQSGSVTVKTPINCAYVVLNIYSGLPSDFNRMLNEGAAALPYEPYKDIKLKEGLISDETVDYILSKQPPIRDNIADNYIKTSANLFNANDVISGYAISIDGIETLTNNYAISHYIPVVARAEYTISGGDTDKDAFIHAAYYTKDKEFIERVDTWNRVTRELTITIPQGVAYLRFNISGGLPTQHNRMFNKGDVALPYEPYYAHQLTGLTLADDVLQQISDEVVVSDKDKFIFDTPIDGTFNTAQEWTQYADFDSRKSAAVYAMYDTLAAQHPDYITKQTLGNDSIGNEISAYKFKPARAVATNPKRSPIIYLVCGTHGGENVPPLATYLMMEQICNNWQSDKLLEALRFNVDFIIIPVSNPSGRDLGTRKNINGVDINRSFPEGFGWQTTDPESPYYGGAVPMQELESQYISQVLTENPNIDICYDFHNFGGTGRDYYIWIPTNGGEKVQHMGQVLMQQMGRKWQAEFDWLPQQHDWFAGFVDDTAGAMVQDHAKAKGVKFTGTFEIARDWQLTTTLARYDQTHCKTMVEAITNWLLINLRNL